jgi:hypothetical protein
MNNTHSYSNEPTIIFYAMSPNTSGVYWFDDLDKCERWISAMHGAQLDPRQVDPEIRSQAVVALGAGRDRWA